MPAMPRRNDDAKGWQIRRLLRSFVVFVFFFSRTKRTVRFLCPFSNCCRSLPRSHREWMRVVDGEATDCLRSVLLARERDPAAVPFFPLSALAHSRRTRPRRARFSACLFARPLGPLPEAGTIPYNVSVN